MRIIGPPTADEDYIPALTTMGATPLFMNTIAPALWLAAVRYGLDPVGVVAQSFKETGGGTFRGKVKPEFCNPAGIKIRYQALYPGITDGDNPLAHAMFPNWEVGAEAHAQHLRAYAGWPVPGLIVDPRYTFVIGKHFCENFEDLSGKWAPSPTYGDELVTIARKLQ